MVNGDEKYVDIKCHQLLGLNFWMIDGFEEGDEPIYWFSPDDYEFYSFIALCEEMFKGLKNSERKYNKKKIKKILGKCR